MNREQELAEIGIIIDMLQSRLTDAMHRGPANGTISELMNNVERIRSFINIDDELNHRLCHQHELSLCSDTEEPAYTVGDLIDMVLDWADQKEILCSSTNLQQWVKTISEVGELGEAILQGNEEKIIDGYGDVLVTLIIGMEISGYSASRCLQHALSQIRGRSGKMVNGLFVKDPNWVEPN